MNKMDKTEADRIKKAVSGTIKKIEKLDAGIIAKARAKLDNLTKPQGSLGSLEELAKIRKGIRRKCDS